MRCLRLTLMGMMGAALSAQVYLASGDAHLTLRQILNPHPEGEILLLPSAKGESLAAAFAGILGEEPALALQLTSQELDPKQPSGRALALLGGWDDALPHWALIGPDLKIHAQGTGAPTGAEVVEAYRGSSLKTQSELLQAFLRDHPDQEEARAQWVLQLRDLAERRTEKLLAARPKAQRDAPLSDEEDERIWSDYADQYQRFMTQGAWRSVQASPSLPIPLAAQVSGSANTSPQLKNLAQRLMPEVVEALRAKPTDQTRWNIWLSLRAAGAQGKASTVLLGLEPLPGARRWPPEAAVDAFVEDAQASGDWHEAEPVLRATFDQNEDLLRRLAQAAQVDKGPGVQLGNAFGFGSWNGDTALLVEAELRLGKWEEADRIFQRVFARAPKAAYAQAAADLARTCGAEALAEKWGKQGR